MAKIFELTKLFYISSEILIESKYSYPCMKYHNSWLKIRSLFNLAIAMGAGYASQSALRIQRCQRQMISILIMLNLRYMLATVWQQLTMGYASHAGYVPRTVRLPRLEWYRYNFFSLITSRSTEISAPSFVKSKTSSSSIFSNRGKI